MESIYCILGWTLLMSSIFMAIMKTDKGIFIQFNKLLNKKQQIKYKQIIKERTCIYLSGMILGLILGLYYLYRYPKDKYKICKFLAIVYIVKLGFYYFIPKSPLMLFSLTTKEQTDAWANIYTEMKSRWQKSLFLGFLGYLMIGKFIN
jgi:hypothetical protein